MTVPRFWREIPHRYHLEASKCTVCNGLHFPPREVCPTCRRASIGKMEKANLSGMGTILEWTRVYKPAPGFDLQVPYVIALIRTAEGPLVAGQVVDGGDIALAPGTPVKAVFRRLAQDGDSGVIHYGTKWMPLPGGPPPAAEPVPEPQAMQEPPGKAEAKPKAEVKPETKPSGRFSFGRKTTL